MMTRPSDILTLAEAAAILELSPSTLLTQVTRGVFPSAAKVGPVWTVTVGDVERYRSTRLGTRPKGGKAKP